MTTDNSDGHSPVTCGFQKCMAAVTTPCPFLKDEPVLRVFDLEPPCKHEWRQYWLNNVAINGFYCILCKKLEK